MSKENVTPVEEKEELKLTQEEMSELVKLTTEQERLSKDFEITKLKRENLFLKAGMRLGVDLEGASMNPETGVLVLPEDSK